MATKRRSTRQAAGRKRSRYTEPDSEEDFEGSTDGEADYAPEPVTPPPQRESKMRKTAQRLQRPSTRSAKSSTKKRAVVIGRQRKPRMTEKEKVEAHKFRGPTDGKIPKWATLPVDILRDIFIFASQPLTGANATWLLKSARTCRAFAAPALEAYYEAPLPLSTQFPHDMLDLMHNSDKGVIRYNTKVTRLEVKMEHLSYTAHQRGLFDLTELALQLPRLQDLQVLNRIDVPPFRRLPLQQWHYPANLFASLSAASTRLKTFRWSRDMILPDESGVCAYIATQHNEKCFEGNIEKLVMCGFDVHDTPATLMTNQDGGEDSLDLAWVLSKVPTLRSLAFSSCDVVREGFLTRMPTALEHLEITNCFKVTSDVLEAYLLKSGASLKSLTLLHNPCLSLSFLPNLKANCPNLESLTLDGHYYSERVAINDAQPEYETLLSPSEVPTWPSTLRHLDLVSLQKWGAEAAVNLFRTLADAAPELPDLRYIHIEAHIDIPWRDRASFRDEWIERLRTVFLRRSAPPNPYHGSKKQWLAWKAVQKDYNGRATPEVLELAFHPRGVSHVELSPHKDPRDTDLASDADASPVKPARRSTRVRLVRSLSQQASVTSEDAGAESEDVSTRSPGKPEPFIQGLCNTVDVRIDNQRPRETTFTERDFLDSEASGDEDWSANADMEFENGGYAW
nr:hypothetical protein B0A51_01270 [Rachicladosporium sp. CCFEE 5018]